MKKTLALAVLIVTTVIFAYVFRLQTVAYMPAPVMAVEDTQIAGTLKGGIGENEEKKLLELRSCDSSEPLYRRGNRYYLGEDKASIDFTFPFYTNEGTALYFMSEKTGLIASDFAPFEAYEGLFISNGTAFYDDMTQADGVTPPHLRSAADEEEYILAALSGSLYINLQPMTVYTAGNRTELKMNSILYLDKEIIRSYSYADDMLVYHEDKVMYGAKVDIGSVSMSYEEFLNYLGMATVTLSSGKTPGSDFLGVDPAAAEDKDADGKNNAAGDRARTGSTDKSGDDGRSNDKTAGNQGNGGQTEYVPGSAVSENDLNAQMEDALNEGKDAAGNNNPTSLSGDGGGGGTAGGSSGSGGGGGSESGGGSGGGSSSSSNTGSGSEGGQGDQGNGGGDELGGEDGPSIPSPSEDYVEPTAALADLEMGVYGMSGVLNVEDPQSRLVRVVVRFFENGKQTSRKNMRSATGFDITNLRPDTNYEIKGEMIFKNERNIRETKSFMANIELSTLPISTLDPISLTFDDAVEYRARQITIPDIRLSGKQSEHGEEVLLNQASKIRVRVDNKDLSISGTPIRRARAGEAVTWISEESFASKRDYSYQLEVRDRFDNVLPLTNGAGGTIASRTQGVAHTSYIIPSVSMTEVLNQVGLQTIGVTLTNVDNVALSNCYLKVLGKDGTVLPAFSQVGSDANSMYQRPVSTSTNGLQSFDLTMLGSGQSIRIVVVADFDLADRPAANPRTAEELGRLSIVTTPISRLGYAYVALEEQPGTKDSLFTITAKVNTERTLEGLRDLMTELPIVITDSSGTEVYRGLDLYGKQIFSKEYMEQIPIGSSITEVTLSPGNATLKLPEIKLKNLPAGSGNAWEAYLQGAQATLAFKSGTFLSKTVYTIQAKATARQGGDDHQVGSPGNILSVQTMRKPVSFIHTDEFTISNFYELYGFRVEDPDGCIEDGKVLMRLYSQGSLIRSLNLDTNYTYENPPLRIGDLKQNTTYTLQFYATRYNEGYTSETMELNKLFDTQNRYTFKTGDGVIGSIEMQGVKMNGSGAMDAAMRVILRDQKGELNAGAYQVVIKGAAGIDTSDNRLAVLETIDGNVDTGTAEYRKDYVYAGKRNWKYRAELMVEVRGYPIMLDSTTFTTESDMDTISSWAEMKAKLVANPAGKYVVISDFEKTDDTLINGSIASQFTGRIDFQGHRVTFGSDVTIPMIIYMGPTGIVENLEVDFNRHSGSAVETGRAPVIRYNYGTVRNVIVNLDWSGKVANIEISGIVARNYTSGVVEDFVVRLNSDFYGMRSLGGVTWYNSGTIRRGYVCSGAGDGVSSITAGSGVYGGLSGNRSYVGGIVGQNDGGLVEDVFNLVNISIETGLNMDYVGGLVGYNNGTVRNSFFVGDIYQFGYGADKQQTQPELYRVGGGAVGTKHASGRVSGLYNFSLQSDPLDPSKPAEYGYHTNGTRNRIYAQTGEVQRLWDDVWYKGVFTAPDNFYIGEQVSAGYYPKLKLSETLEASQDSVSLPPAPAVNAPEYVSNIIDSQTDNSAELTLYFRNPNGYGIAEVSIDNLNTEIITQSATANFYEVKVRVNQPLKYLSSYRLGFVSYRRTETSTPTLVRYGDVRPMYVAVKFYKGIWTVDDWAAMELDLESNYKLEQDINFNTQGSSTDKMVTLGTFKGELDGRGHTLYNLKPTNNYSYIFEAATGAVFSNLNVEGMNFHINDAAKSRAIRAGFVGTAEETDFQNVFLNDVSMTGVPNMAGALVGSVSFGNVTDCRVEHVAVSTASLVGYPLHTGGLIGYANAVAVRNCYVSGLELEAAQGISSQGIGGLAGRIEGSDEVSSCYVQGQIRSSFDRTGGAVGSSQTDLSRIWTYVNISTNMPGGGGILGYAETVLGIKHCVVVGDIVTGASSGFGRIYGAVASSSMTVTVADCVAYDGQIIGSKASPDLLDVNILATGAELETQALYRDEARLGESFDLAGDSGFAVADGYMPMLHAQAGALLLPQTPVMRRDERLQIADASLTQNSGGDYSLQIQVLVGNSPFKPTEVRCTGMELGDGTISLYNEAAGIWLLKYEHVTLKQYLSLYQVEVVFKHGAASQSVSYQITGNYSRVIRNADEWVTYMKDYGQNYENFVIAGDIDLSTVSQATLAENKLMNLKINSLKSTGGTHTIKGLKYTTTGNGESMISNLSGTIENLVFEDITIDNRLFGGSYIGVIGQNQGIVKNVTFRRINVNGNTGTHIGCVGINTGTLTDITVEDVAISGTGSKNMYVGGLVGYNAGTVSQITAQGSSKASSLNYAGYKGRNSSVGAQLPVKADYSYRVEGYFYVGGIIGYTAVPFEDITLKATYIEGTQYTGGISGTNVIGTTKNIIVGDPLDQILPVRIVGKGYYTGGIYGLGQRQDIAYGYVEDSAVYNSFISSSGLYTGGVVGNSAWYLVARRCLVDSCTILSTNGEEGYTGGISGSGGVTRCEVRNSDVVGTGIVGGLTAVTANELSFSAVIDTNVTGSKSGIGGLVGRAKANCAPTGCIVTGSVITGTQTGSCVGGLVGINFNGVTRSAVIDTKVTGYTQVGGISGEVSGGLYKWLNCEADVEAVSGMAGAFAGRLYDFDNYAISPIIERNTKVSYVTLGGSVTAPAYSSAFAGCLSYKPAKRDMAGNIVTRGNPYLSSAQYNRILLTSSVTCTSQTDTASRWAYFSLAGNVAEDKITTMDPDYAGPRLIDTIQQVGTNTAFSSVWKGVTVKDSAGISLMGAPTGADYSQWSSATPDQKKKMTLVSFGDMKNATYWSDRGIAQGGYYTVTTALSANRFPYVLYSTMYAGRTMASYQNKSLKGADGQPLDTFDIPNGTEVMSLMSLMTVAPRDLVTAYASGAGTLNLELADGLHGLKLAVSDGTGEILSTVIEKRVYTMPYDFSTSLAVTISDGEYTEEYIISAGDMARTVMNWNGNYYYLTSAGLRSSGENWEEETEDQLGQAAAADLTLTASASDAAARTVKVSQRLRSGRFLHIYKGQAIDMDGAVWDVETGRIVDRVDFTNLQWQETAPVQSYAFKGKYLDVYANFTESKDSLSDSLPEDAGSTNLDSQTFVKSGRLFALDGSVPVKKGALLADYCSGSRYLTVLGADGALHDMETGITVPKNFRNMSIRELADNLDSDAKIAIGRYNDGTVFAFNYLTGTLQELAGDTYFDTGEDNGLVDYASSWLDSKLGSWFGFNNSGYNGSMNLINDVQSGGLDAALGQLSGGSNDKDAAKAADPNAAAGDSNGETASKSGTGDAAGDTDRTDLEKSADIGGGDDSDDDGFSGSFTGFDEEEANAEDGPEEDAQSGENQNYADATNRSSRKNGISEQTLNSKDKTEDGLDNKNGNSDKTETDSREERNAKTAIDTQVLAANTDGTDSQSASTGQTGAGGTDNTGAGSADNAGDESGGRAANGGGAATAGTTAGTTETGELTGSARSNADTGSRGTSDSKDSSSKTVSSDGEGAADTGGSAIVSGDSGSNGSAVSDERNSKTTKAGEEAKEDGREVVAADSRERMISVYDAQSGEYKVYDVDEFLSAPKTQLVSVDEKVQQLAQQGLITYQSNLNTEEFVEKNRNGLLVFAATTTAILLLLVYLADKRKRGRRK